MTSLNDALLSVTLERLGWTLLHSIWQFVVIAILLRAGLGLLRSRSAHLRYLSACSGLLVMLATSAVTFCSLGDTASATLSIRSGEVIGSSLPAERRVLDGFDETHQGATAAAALPPTLTSMSSPGSPLSADDRQKRLTADRSSGLVAQTETSGVLGTIVDAVAPWLPWIALASVPVRLLTGLSPAQLEAILAHELAHIRRFDYLVNLMQTVAETLLFYHPAVWWISRRIRRERELCCDDVAVHACGSTRTILSDMPPPVMCARPCTGRSLIRRLITAAYIRVGSRSSSPRVRPNSAMESSTFSFRVSKQTLRTSEYPLLCRPLEAMPMSV